MTKNNICYSDTKNIVIGSILTIGIFLSYIPQFYTIYKKYSINGINYITLFLSNIGAFLNLLGIIFTMITKFSCCSDYSVSVCLQTLLPIFQMTTPWISQLILLIFFIFITYKTYDTNRIYYIKILITYIIIIVSLIIIGLCVLINKNSNEVIYGEILNSISSIIALFLFIPQILHTYSIKTSGNLSLITLSIQMPGAFLVFVYQSFFTNSSVINGIPYLISGIQQFFLLILCIYYDYFYYSIKNEELRELIN